jgi:hypothetical protein
MSGYQDILLGSRWMQGTTEYFVVQPPDEEGEVIVWSNFMKEKLNTWKGNRDEFLEKFKWKSNPGGEKSV